MEAVSQRRVDVMRALVIAGADLDLPDRVSVVLGTETNHCRLRRLNGNMFIHVPFYL
jgi:hypothetical protein